MQCKSLQISESAKCINIKKFESKQYDHNQPVFKTKREKNTSPKRRLKAISEANPLFYSIVVELCLYGREGMPMTRNLMMQMNDAVCSTEWHAMQ